MTPEERAQDVVFRWNREYHGWTEEHRSSLLGMDAYDHQAAMIAGAIRDAVAESREACVQIAIATNDCCECGDAGCHVGLLCPTAKAIRALTVE